MPKHKDAAVQPPPIGDKLVGWAPSVLASLMVGTALWAGASAALNIWTSGVVLMLATLLLVRLLTRQALPQAGAELVSAPLVDEVLPLWRRHIDSVRAQSEAAAHDSSDEALNEQAEHSALCNSLGELNRSSRELKDAGVAVQDEYERVLMSFQSQDRLNQMLSCVIDDILRLTDWVREGNDLSAAQAGEWLARLDASYMMEEQRSEHHGNTTIQRETTVEFF